MTNKKLYESREPKSLIQGTLKVLSELQSEVLEEKLSIKNQMIMTGIAYSIADCKHNYGETFEKDFKDELKILEYNHEQFHGKNQEHING